MIVQVAIPLRLDRTLDYKVPEYLQKDVKVGIRVLVPLKFQIITGFVVKITDESEFDKLKNIYDIVDKKPILSDEIINICKQISEYYVCDFSITLRAALPAFSLLEVENFYRLNRENIENYYKSGVKLKKNRNLLLEFLLDFKSKIVKEKYLKKMFKYKDLKFDLNYLSDNSILEKFQKVTHSKIQEKHKEIVIKSFDNKNIDDILSELLKKPKLNSSKINLINTLLYEDIANMQLNLSEFQKKYKTTKTAIDYLKKNDLIQISKVKVVREVLDKNVKIEDKLQFNDEQELAYSEILKKINANEFEEFLLYGITGSGKTEVYLQLISKTIDMGKEVICLVPEISLTPQMVDRFQKRFGTNIAVIHSALSDGEKYDEWQKIIDRKVKIVVGARSAIFAPFNNLGLVIIDEEHENTYKQNENPRYNTDHVAQLRCKQNSAVLVLGTATPKLESFYRTYKNDLKLLKLTKRAKANKLPTISIVDMRNELKNKNKSIFSKRLLTLIKDRLEKQEQVIIFLNQRGFNTFVLCRDCGEAVKCPYCEISLKYHQNDFHLKCHYCDYQISLPKLCPNCKSTKIRYFGTGTQKVESEINKFFSNAKVLRMDSDTVKKKNAYKIFLDKFKRNEFNVLVGTQMISKGLDFPKVTLVGIISADMMLNLSDFRASERAFSMILQVAGRAGRDSIPGEVVVQTYMPDHPCLNYVKSHDYLRFFKYEIRNRKELLYPPFSNVININFRSQNYEENIKAINLFKKILSNNLLDNNVKKYKLIGPSPCYIEKIKTFYRMQMLIKCIDVDAVTKCINRTVSEFKKDKLSKHCYTIIDVDAKNIM